MTPPVVVCHLALLPNQPSLCGLPAGPGIIRSHFLLHVTCFDCCVAFRSQYELFDSNDPGFTGYAQNPEGCDFE